VTLVSQPGPLPPFFLLRADPRVKSECEGVVVGVIPKGGDDGGRVGGCVGSDA
jgi:hypothetical protein